MEKLIERHLAAYDDDVDERWNRLQTSLQRRFGRNTSIEAVLFLIGVQSRGRGYEPEMGREEKESVIMEGTFCTFEKLGLYQRVGLDENGFWIWERCVEQIPKLPIDDQEKLLKLGIITYFDDIGSENQPSVA